jgi:NitT/TauT family transport system substrate-binding protein
MEYIYDRALADAGVAADDIKTSEIKKIPVRLQMLQAGQLKAAVLPWTLFALSESEGAVPLLDQEAAASYGSTLLVFSQKWLDGQSAATDLDKFIVAYSKAVDDINAAPNDYRALLAEKAKLPAGLAESYPVREYPMIELPRADVFDDVVSWMVEKAYIDEAIPYPDLVFAAAGA